MPPERLPGGRADCQDTSPVCSSWCLLMTTSSCFPSSQVPGQEHQPKPTGFRPQLILIVSASLVTIIIVNEKSDNNSFLSLNYCGLGTLLSSLPTSGFLSLAPIDILGWIIHGCGGFPGCCRHCRVSSSISGLYPSDHCSSFSSLEMKNVSRCCPMSPGRQTAPRFLQGEPLTYTNSFTVTAILMKLE